MRALAVALLALAACRGEPTPIAAEPVATSTTSYELRVSEVAQTAAKAVVTLYVGDRGGTERAMGSGFVVGADGLVATSLHVIGEGRPIAVELADGRRFDVTSIRAFDRSLDVALLRIDADGLPTLPIGDPTTLGQGDPMLALGNPLGFERSVVPGYVSALRELEGRPMIQLAMAIEPGNSGGPVVDLAGRVHGVVTMKSMVTDDLGFALRIDAVKRLHAQPNPVTMSRWLTLGALDPAKWTERFGARWRQRAGRIVVDRPGHGMAGRSLLLQNRTAPKLPYTVQADVRLDDEDGAAGIAFASDGDQVHYAFYPTRNRLRVTRFMGPQVFQWRILFDAPSDAFRPGEWNRLAVRHEGDRLVCYVNDHRVAEIVERTLPAGRVGFVKFRDTSAQMKHLQVSSDGAAPAVSPVEALKRQARELEWQATQLRRRAQERHEALVHEALVRAIEKPDLLRAALLVAKLDDEEVDVEAYVDRVAQMAEAIRKDLDPRATPAERLAALDTYLFEENGFHGSRDEYHHRANSYLSSVIDDREGLPITLSVLYMAIAERLDVEVHGVALPGHFVVRYGQTLIDPFDRGAVLPASAAAALVNRHARRRVREEDFAPVPARDVVTRMLRNLVGAAATEPADQLRYLDALLAVDPNAAVERYRRAQLGARAGRVPAAIADLERLLADEPEGIDLTEIARWRTLLEGSARQ